MYRHRPEAGGTHGPRPVGKHRPALPRTIFFSRTRNNLTSPHPRFPPCPTAHARARQIRPLPLFTWASTPPRTTDGPPPAPSFISFFPFTLATRAPTQRRMSLENRPWTAVTPAAQTTNDRNNGLAGAGSRRTDRVSAGDHAGATHSLQDTSLGAASASNNMTGHDVEGEGRPPYTHVSICVSFPAYAMCRGAPERSD